MSIRLSSFLANIASACQCDEPAPNGGTWEISRTLNYRLGLARLVLGSRGTGSAVQPMGSILLQAFTLADGSPCVKANLSWADQAAGAMRAVYAKPSTNWESEARLVAADWLAGPPESKLVAMPSPAAEAAEVHEPLAAAV
jgi:hypothetical protein